MRWPSAGELVMPYQSSVGGSGTSRRRVDKSCLRFVTVRFLMPDVSRTINGVRMFGRATAMVQMIWSAVLASIMTVAGPEGDRNPVSVPTTPSWPGCPAFPFCAPQAEAGTSRAVERSASPQGMACGHRLVRRGEAL